MTAYRWAWLAVMFLIALVIHLAGCAAVPPDCRDYRESQMREGKVVLWCER